MIINPVLTLSCLYLLANFFAMMLGVSSGGMTLDGYFFKLESSSLIYSFLLQVLILFFMCFSFVAMRSKVDFKKLVLGASWGWFLALVQTSFLIFSLVMEVNVAGDGARIEGGSLINYIYIFLQSDILYLLIGISLVSNRLFLTNTVIFLISMFLRGWMGGIIVVFFIILARYYPVRISIRNSVVVLISILIFLIVLPGLVEAKWAMRSGVSVGEFFGGVSDAFSVEKYIISFEYLLNRFQHVGHVALLLENSDKMYSSLNDGVFISYWMDGLPQYTFLKFFDINTYKVNSYMVEYFFDIKEPVWNTNPGVAGWFFILREQFVFMILYLFLVVVLPFYLIGRYAGNAMLMLVACCAIIYLFHGWFGVYFNIVFYALMLFLICKSRFYISHWAGSSANKVVC